MAHPTKMFAAKSYTDFGVIRYTVGCAVRTINSMPTKMFAAKSYTDFGVI